MTRHFISEAITPVELDPNAAAVGEPALPRRFAWREAEYEIAEVLETWKESGPCTSGSDEQYLRKHWYRLRTKTGEVMTIYFERKARSSHDRKRRWWLHSLEDAGSEDGEG
jgi:phosphoribosylglycinamide formyltransferase-1